MERLPDPLQLSCPESRICFKEKQSHGRSVLPRERTKILQLPVTPTEWLPIAEKSIHRLLLNSPTMELSACLGAGSSLRNCDRLCHGKTTCLPFSCPESRICFKVKTVTRTERASQGKNKISSLIGHTNGVAPSSQRRALPALVELTYISARPGAGSSLRNCDRLCHGKST